jgi:hypothetical protein
MASVSPRSDGYLRFAWPGRSASAWWLAVIGSVVAGYALRLVGVPMPLPNQISDNPLLYNGAIVLISVIIGLPVLFLLKFLYAPFDFALLPSGWLREVFRDKHKRCILLITAISILIYPLLVTLGWRWYLSGATPSAPDNEQIITVRHITELVSLRAKLQICLEKLQRPDFERRINQYEEMAKAEVVPHQMMHLEQSGIMLFEGTLREIDDVYQQCSSADLKENLFAEPPPERMDMTVPGEPQNISIDNVRRYRRVYLKAERAIRTITNLKSYLEDQIKLTTEKIAEGSGSSSWRLGGS